jgi:ribonuclease G
VIAVSRRGEVVRIALLRGDILAEFYHWNLAAPDGVGDIYTGRVDAVMPGLAGRFVSLGGANMSGFLPDSAGGKTLSIGDYASLRVTRAAQAEKGPRLELVAGPHGESPGLLRRGPGPLLELAARLPGEAVVLDDYALMAELRPALEARMSYAAAAFDEVLEDEVAALAEPIAALPHGGRLHISPAPAATLLDVDAAGASDMAPLAFNNAIIPEVCRQILLRNLSGGILIDFAGLKPAARAKLGEPLRSALKSDPLHPDLLGFSHLGMAELVRRRVRPPLHELLTP